MLRLTQSRGYEHMVSRGHGDLELTDPRAMTQFFHEKRPEVVVLAAGRVGSIVSFNKGAGGIGQGSGGIYGSYRMGHQQAGWCPQKAVGFFENTESRVAALQQVERVALHDIRVVS